VSFVDRWDLMVQGVLVGEAMLRRLSGPRRGRGGELISYYLLFSDILYLSVMLCVPRIQGHRGIPSGSTAGKAPPDARMQQVGASIPPAHMYVLALIY
jgi:hypothetical protein